MNTFITQHCKTFQKTKLFFYPFFFNFFRPLVEEKLELEKLAMEKIKNAQTSVSIVSHAKVDLSQDLTLIISYCVKINALDGSILDQENKRQKNTKKFVDRHHNNVPFPCKKCTQNHHHLLTDHNRA